MNIAVLSDLHIGLGACAKDLCPMPSRRARKEMQRFNNKVETEYVEKFLKLLKEQNITAEYLILPGDITDRAEPEEVQLASNVVSKIATALNVDERNIIFVPGNHDVDWTVFDPKDTTGIRWDQRYVPISSNKFLFSRIIQNADKNIFSFPFFTAWIFDNLFVLGYNSASHDSPCSSKDIHHGLIEDTHIQEMEKYITSVSLPDDVFRIFVVHHHPVNYSSPAGDHDFSYMQNSEKLLDFLHRYHFDFFIHGHRHHPRFTTHSTATYPYIPILCAGSFSYEMDTTWAGVVNNQFHLITIGGRSKTEKLITGKITSWANNYCRGWSPSDERSTGIHHIIPFGRYVMPTELDAKLTPFIQDWFRSRDHIKWREIIEHFPELEYLPFSSAIDAFTRIGQRLGKQPMFEVEKDLILY